MDTNRTTAQKVEDMIDYAAPLIDRWPKLYKHTLGERIMDKMYQLSEICTAAELKYYKKTTLQELDIQNHMLQKLVRRAARTEYSMRQKDGTQGKRFLLNGQHYSVWSEKITEIGKLIGGWMKSVAERK